MTLRTSAARSMVWLAIEAGCSTLLSIASTFFMAHIVGPTYLGLAALATGLISILNLITEALFQDALIQRPELTREHEDTAFTAAVTIGVILFFGTILCARPLAQLFAEPDLEPVLQVLASVLLMTGMNGVPMARLRRAFAFNVLAVRTLASRLAGAILGPILAFLGFGVWSFVAQVMAAAIIGTVLVASHARYRPRLFFSWARFRELIVIALPILLTALLGMARLRIFSVLVGLYVGVTGLGYLNMAFKTVDTLRDFLYMAIYQLGISLFSRQWSDPERLQRTFRHGTQVACLLAQPVFAGMIVVADTLIQVVLGEAWAPIEPLVQMLAALAMLYFLISQAEPVTIALGKPILSTLISVGMLTMLVAGIVLLKPGDERTSMAIWVAALLCSTLAWFVGLHRLTRWPLRAIIGAGLPALACAVAMACVVRVLDIAIFGSWPPVWALVGQVGAGVVSYAALTLLFNRSPLLELLSLIRTGLARAESGPPVAPAATPQPDSGKAGTDD